MIKHLLLVLFFLGLLFFSCENKKDTIKENIKKETINKSIKNTLHADNQKYKFKKITSPSLVDLKSIDSSIQIDLKYAGNDNFMKKRLYFHTNELLLQKDVAIRLSKVQMYLKSLHPKYSLLVYDGARPLSVQQEMWRALDSIPVEKRVKFVSNPANGSLHNFGAAVDLTICDEDKVPLDMGAGYDDIRELAYPRLEQHFLSIGKLTIHQVDNRKLLRKVMKTQGFVNIPTEWWHFNSCSRNEAKKKYQIMK
ncbi:MAG: M15 family metallopeptidase [Flavobacteriia bacterium]|nr:M15 family metallopeptidase [Flavobacteriia bacterium]